MSAAWEVVIGLEIHTQLATRSKIFSGASTAYGAEPNTQACLVDLGQLVARIAAENADVASSTSAWGRTWPRRRRSRPSS